MNQSGSIEPLAVLLALPGLALLLRELAWSSLQLGLAAARRLPPWIGASRGWAYTHPLRAWAGGRFPRAYRFAAARLTPRAFTGLPLTLLAAAALYLALLFGELVEEIGEEETIGLDAALGAWLDRYRSEPAVTALLWVTNLGSDPSLLAAIVVATGFLWAYRRGCLVLPLWATFLGAEATTWIGKIAMGRARPDFVTLATAISPSFPSGHTTGATAVYGFIAYALARDLRAGRARFEIAYWTVLLILLVGFSRAFLSVHYPSDVAGGLLVGGFWLLVGFTLAEWRRSPAGSDSAPPDGGSDNPPEAGSPLPDRVSRAP